MTTVNRHGWHAHRQVSPASWQINRHAYFLRLTWLIAGSSTPGVLATWKVYEKEYNLDLEEVLRSMHSLPGVYVTLILVSVCSISRYPNRGQVSLQNAYNVTVSFTPSSHSVASSDGAARSPKTSSRKSRDSKT